MTIERPRRPTLETVAAAAGVSRATASRVVNRDPRVADDLRERVEQAIEALGYVPNRAARSLVTRRAGSVALVLGEPVEFGAADPYLASITVGVSQALLDTGLLLVVIMRRAGDRGARLLEYLRGGHVDGVLLASVHDGDPLPAQLAGLGIPTAVGGRLSATGTDLACVDVDNRGGGQAAARRLVARGCRRIAMIAGPADMTAAADRLAGFRAGLGERPPVAVVPGDFTLDGGRAAMTELLHREPAVDGVFVANDFMALGALEALREAGRAVPGQVAVIGFDDIDLARHAVPALTTVRQPMAEQARLLVDLLLRRLAGSEVPALTTLDVELVLRATA